MKTQCVKVHINTKEIYLQIVIFETCCSHHFYYADIDECANGHRDEFGHHSCPSDEACFNTPGSFTCICPDGYRLNNHNNQCEGMTYMYMYITVVLPTYSSSYS